MSATDDRPIADLSDPAEEPEKPRPRWYRPAPLRKGGGKVGRNDPCPCGSGRKLKKCCLWSTR